MTFEGNYTSYMNDYNKSPWTSRDNRKFWHIIYGVPETNIRAAAALARQRGAGLVQITDAVMDNPYDRLPSESYMQTLLSGISGSRPHVAPLRPFRRGGVPALPPSFLEVKDVDYSSVDLAWDGSSGVDAPFAFAIYLFEKEVARIPGYMSRIRIGNLRGWNALTFTVRAVAKDGIPSDPSPSQSIRLKHLPESKPVMNIKHTRTTDSLIYEADVYLPYGFIRIYITDPSKSCSLHKKTPEPAWPINHAAGFACAHYMIEGKTLYRYTGAIPANIDLYPWSWTPITSRDNVQVERNGYHYRWVVKRNLIEKITLDTSKYVIQAEGYNLIANVFSPCPEKFWTSSDSWSYCLGYDCSKCKLTNTGWCDKAIRSIENDIDRRHFTSNQGYLAAEGVCWANGLGIGCKVIVEGLDRRHKNCTISGATLRNAYNDIKAQGGCKCGRKILENGCSVRIAHENGCGNIQHKKLFLDLENMESSIPNDSED
jgi:hypothetical protein